MMASSWPCPIHNEPIIMLAVISPRHNGKRKTKHFGRSGLRLLVRKQDFAAHTAPQAGAPLEIQLILDRSVDRQHTIDLLQF